MVYRYNNIKLPKCGLFKQTWYLHVHINFIIVFLYSALFFERYHAILSVVQRCPVFADITVRVLYKYLNRYFTFKCIMSNEVRFKLKRNSKISPNSHGRLTKVLSHFTFAKTQIFSFIIAWIVRKSFSSTQKQPISYNHVCSKYRHDSSFLAIRNLVSYFQF